MARTVDDSALEELLDVVYDAPLHPEGWIELRDAIVKATGSTGCSIHLRSGQDEGVTRWIMPLARAEACEAYDVHYASIDPLSARAATCTRPDMLSDDTTVVSRADLVHTEFYNGWAAPHDFNWMYGTALPLGSADYAFFGLSRSKRSGPLDTEMRSVIDALLPHIHRMLRFDSRLQRDRCIERSVLSALDEFRVGILLLDGSGNTVFANFRANEILASHDGLLLDRRGRPRAVDAKTAARLKSLIQNATAQRSVGARRLSSTGVLAIPRAARRSPFVLTVVPISRSADENGANLGAHAIVLVDDPSASPSTPMALLSTIYDMTAAESRVATLLASGMPLCEIAETLGKSVGTVRNQLKQIFSKTGVSRQAELVGLLLRVSPPLANLQ